MELNNEETLKFSQIMFKGEGREQQEISRLSDKEISKLKELYAQKIAFDTVNGHIQPPPDVKDSNDPQDPPKNEGVVATICCCFFPENNRSNFDITTGIFMKRVLSTFLIWKSNFLTIDEGRTEFYGPLWLTFTYVIILGLSANLNEYFIMPVNFKFQNMLMIKALTITALFKILEPFMYAAILRCLKGKITNKESIVLTGYSVVLYFIPTILCLIPSMYWHMGMLALAAVLRAFFLFRNYSSKMQSKSYVILVVILIMEALICFILMKTLFHNDFGYNLSDGTKRVFGHHLGLRNFNE